MPSADDRTRSPEAARAVRARPRRVPTFGSTAPCRSLVLKFDAVTKVYERGTVALREVSLSVEEGEFAFLIGPSGAGKTTLLRLILREEQPTGGRFMVSVKTSGRSNRVNYQNCGSGSAASSRTTGSSTRARSSRTSRSRPELPAARFPQRRSALRKCLPSSGWMGRATTSHESSQEGSNSGRAWHARS